MTATVIITRPLAQAEPLAAQLSSLGIGCRIFPLLDIQPLSDVIPLKTKLSQLDAYALVAFVSPNAVDAVFAHLTHWPAGVIAAVVGPGSRQALARHGVTDANANIVSPLDTQRTDSETLLEALDLDQLKGKKALIIRAETGRELLAERLRDAGVEVEQLSAYRRGALALDEARQALLKDLLEQPNAWVITSSEALRNLQDSVLQSAGQSGWAKMLSKRLIVPHERIAETAHGLGFEQVLLTGSGDAALVAAIQSCI